MRQFSLFLSVIALLFGMAGIVNADSIEWKITDGGNGHFYEAVSSTVSGWNDANELANGVIFNNMNGHLATLTSEEENNWVWTNLNSIIGYFIGGTDQDVEGSWEWVTGEAWTYSNWNSGEPNDVPWLLDTGEDGLLFASNGKWNDVPITGYALGGYIIEYEPAPVPEPATMLLFGSGLIGLAGFRRKFRKR